MTPAPLTLESLSCGYAGRALLENLSLDIPARSLCCVLGPNGAGKTTLLRTLARTLPPVAGRVRLEGNDMAGLPAAALARTLAVVTLNPVPEDMDAGEYVLLGRTPHAERFRLMETRRDHAAMRQAMQVTGTWELRGQPLARISDGELQLVRLARALAQEPRVLLLDEPTSHLDIRNQVRVLETITRLEHELELTVVMALHDLTLAGQFGTLLVLLGGGQIQASGAPEAVLRADTLERVYGTPVRVIGHPENGRPCVLPRLGS